MILRRKSLQLINCQVNIMQFTRIFILALVLFFSSCKQSGNHLGKETSAYLLQHANNPVDWYPWGEEALNLAKKEDKLIIVSIGYSSCHWCHVMERECFSDTSVAKLMNDHFINIKVDREERPDIDGIYMAACQVSNGSCGWPLNAIILPNGKPLWTGTYFPKDQWKKILTSFIEMKKEDPESLLKNADQLSNNINELYHSDKVIGASLTTSDIKSMTSNILDVSDKQFGGKKSAQKFPDAEYHQLLLNLGYYQKNETAKQHALFSLEKICNSGLYDYLQGGFFRYTVDNKWKIPHFEKMGYDQANMIRLLSNAYLISKNELFKKRMMKSAEFLMTEFSDPSGGFYTATDAESEHEEGKYYVWTVNEIEQILKDPLEIKIATAYYGLNNGGNWEKGKNVLSVSKSEIELSKEIGIDPNKLTGLLSSINTKLLTARKKRIAPFKDTKVITSWTAANANALFIAYKASGDERLLSRAILATEFIKTKMTANGQLMRNFTGGKASIDGFLEDYANTISLYLSAYQATFNSAYIDEAKAITETVINSFYDKNKQTFYFTKATDANLVTRKTENLDGNLPAACALMADNLYLLGHLLTNVEWIEISSKTFDKVSNEIKNSPRADFYSSWLSHALLANKDLHEIAIMGNNYKALLKEINQVYLPDAILLGGTSEGKFELLQGKLNSSATLIYVCKKKVCKLPVKSVQEALNQMN